MWVYFFHTIVAMYLIIGCLIYMSLILQFSNAGQPIRIRLLYKKQKKNKKTQKNPKNTKQTKKLIKTGISYYNCVVIETLHIVYCFFLNNKTVSLGLVAVSSITNRICGFEAYIRFRLNIQYK